MTPEQINGYIRELEILEDNGQLSNADISKLNNNLKARDIHAYEHFMSEMYEISHTFTPQQLKRIGDVLLSHGKTLKCSICGKNIVGKRDRSGRLAKVMSIDHNQPKSKGGKRKSGSGNLGFSHNECNEAKGDMLGCVSFYDDPEIIAEYLKSETWRLLSERISIKKEVSYEIYSFFVPQMSRKKKKKQQKKEQKYYDRISKLDKKGNKEQPRMRPRNESSPRPRLPDNCHTR